MKEKLKKILTIGIIIWILWIGYLPVYWINDGRSSSVLFPYDPNQRTNSTRCTTWDCTNLGDVVVVKNEHSIINRLLEVFGLDSDTFNWDHKFIYYAKAIVNLALWLLSLIALVMTIYTFYMMFFSDNEAWIKKAKWNLLWIFMALAIVGLSWLVVSFIFRWYQSNWQTSLPQSY